MSNIPPTLTDLEDLARGAGEIILSRFQAKHDIQRKLAADIVTEADSLAEAFIIGEIQKRWRDHCIVAEESGANRQESEYCWYIDPLDGTINFAHGLPVFCVSIGLTQHGKPILGAIYAPSYDEMYTAQSGKGAFLNEKKLSVSTTTALMDSLLMMEYPNLNNNRDETTLHRFQTLRMQTRGIRQLGCAAMAMCYTARGSADGYWQPEIHPWDIAAGTLLVREAGGVVTNYAGDDLDLSGNISIIAGNPAMHAILREQLA